MTIKELYSIYLAHPKVSKDTRDNVEGAIYFSLKGDRFDGNKFAQDALNKGAAYVVVDDLSAVDPNNSRVIHVSDGLKTLQLLARYHRAQFEGKVIAITGSNGKTSTKELMARVLRMSYTVSSTPGNYNNHIGIPLMLLQTPMDADYVIVEMGASRIGDIASYCDIAQPDYGLITNVGEAHMETFGGKEGVRQGKGELYSYISKNGGRVFICADEDHLQKMAKVRGINKPVLYYDSDMPNENINEFRAHVIEWQTKILFEVDDANGITHLISSSLHGLYNYRNILSAMAVGNYFGVPIAAMAKAVNTYKPNANRSEVRKIGTNEYYLDAYNANPTSMKLSLDAFNGARPDRKVLVLGDMLELGDYSGKAHQEIVDYIEQFQGVDKIFLVGSEFGKTNYSDDMQKFQSVQDLKRVWERSNWQNQYIFLKGSRSIQLEKLLD